MRILFAEDEPTLREFVTRGLTEAGYAVDAFADGEEAWLAASTVPYDVAILDVNLPGIDGFELCRRIRSTPARGTGDPLPHRSRRDRRSRHGARPGSRGLPRQTLRLCRVVGAHPFAPPPRAGDGGRARGRRPRLDPSARKVSVAGSPINLTAEEFAVLEYLMRNAGRVVTKAMIAEHVWNFDLGAESNFIEVYIYALRKKIDAPYGRQLIQTMRGAGYRIDAP